MIKLKPNKERSNQAVLAMKFVLVASGLMLFAQGYTVKILMDIENGNYFSLGSGENLLIGIGIIGFLFMVAFIFSAVFFIMWFRRAYYNLHQLLPGKLKYSEGWAAGAWFVPIFNLFGPYQISAEMHKNTENLLVENELDKRDSSRFSTVGWWWGLWITSTVISQVSNNMDDLSSTGAWMSIVASLISIGSGFMAIRMIQNYTKMEDLLPQINDVSARGGIDESDLLDSGI
jgi:hypothetical protein